MSVPMRGRVRALSPAMLTCVASLASGLLIAGPDIAAQPESIPSEARFEWNDRHWYLEDRWEAEGTLALRSFSAGYYENAPFDGRVFPQAGFLPEKDRYYRWLREELPAGRPEDPVAYELERGQANLAYGYGVLPGMVVRDGSLTKAGLLDGEISNLGATGSFTPGELVQIRAVEVNKKNLMLVISPVCRTTQGHRRLRARLRFDLGKAAMARRDGVEPAVREWLEPVSAGEVARRCGPASGTPVLRWTAETRPADVRRELGEPDVTAERANGEVLVYGSLRLEFANDRLIGYSQREP